MPNELGRLDVKRKSGTELFHRNGENMGFDVLSFWRWCVSDLVSNTSRGVLAEYIVARALGLASEGVRDEWAPYDLRTSKGTKIEVKSAAYIQNWNQKSLSSISFVVPKTRGFDPDTGKLEDEAKRQADVYVFALLHHTDKKTIDPLNLDQWRFYVVSTKTLDERERSQHSITLRSLEGLSSGAVSYDQLPRAFEECIG